MNYPFSLVLVVAGSMEWQASAGRSSSCLSGQTQGSAVWLSGRFDSIAGESPPRPCEPDRTRGYVGENEYGIAESRGKLWCDEGIPWSATRCFSLAPCECWSLRPPRDWGDRTSGARRIGARDDRIVSLLRMAIRRSILLKKTNTAGRLLLRGGSKTTTHSGSSALPIVSVGTQCCCCCFYCFASTDIAISVAGSNKPQQEQSLPHDWYTGSEFLINLFPSWWVPSSSSPQCAIGPKTTFETEKYSETGENYAGSTWTGLHSKLRHFQFGRKGGVLLMNVSSLISFWQFFLPGSAVNLSYRYGESLRLSEATEKRKWRIDGHQICYRAQET